MFKELKLKNLGNYHDLYVQSDTLMLADVFQNFRNKCIEIYELDPTHFLSALGLAWQACSNKTEVDLELLTNNDRLFMAENGIRGGTSQAIKKNYDKNIKSSYLMYLDGKNLHGWAMSQKLHVNGFRWVEDLSQFKEDFIKSYDENSGKGSFPEVDVEYPKNLFNLHRDLPFLPERKEIGKCNKLVCDFHYKKNYAVHINALKQALNHGLILKKCTGQFNLIKKYR